MNNSLTQIDAEFCDHYKELLVIQKKVYDSISYYPFDLEKDEITQAIINRMYAFWHFHAENNKNLLNREVNTTASDFFTETCLFFIKAFFKQDQYKMDVYSEKNILKEKSKKSIKPDISIWKDKQLLAVIELKVNDGWNRKGMLDHLENRKKQIQSIWPNTYFAAISFWNFPSIDNNNHPDYIGLLNYRGETVNHIATGKTFEQILKRILITKSLDLAT